MDTWHEANEDEERILRESILDMRNTIDRKLSAAMSERASSMTPNDVRNMSPIEARRALDSIVNWAIHGGKTTLSAHSLIGAIIDAAVAEERERCARIADAHFEVARADALDGNGEDGYIYIGRIVHEIRKG